MKKTLWIIGILLALYLIARAISWPFSVDPSDPSTYAKDWGGPTLFGAALVHCGPGVLAALGIIGGIVRGRLRAARSRRTTSVTSTGRTDV
jgi:hypothetical protein